MNIELKFMLAITHRLPKVKGAGWFANKLKAIYNRKTRPNENITFNGIKMELEPSECVDGGILFYPQLYDWRELDFIRKNLIEGGRFVDAGANIGWYSLIASQVVGGEGEVMAIEMDPYNAKKLNYNIMLNGIDNIRVIQAGLSDRNEKLKIRMNLTGNRGGNSLINANANEDGDVIVCRHLLDILVESGWDRIDGLKIDIEGMEFRVLSAFFEQAPRQLYPGFIIVELNSEYEERGVTELHGLFKSCGYKVIHKMGLNSIYKLDGINEK